MNAQDFASSLDIKIERSPRTDRCALKTYSDGRNIIQVPKKQNLDDTEGQRLLWHEIAHYLDKAHHYGGHSQLTAFFAVGEYSNKFEYQGTLRRNAAYLLKHRTPMDLVLRIKVPGKVITSLDELRAAPDDVAPRSFKERIFRRVAEWESNRDRYFNQEVELFAEGFAEYMAHRDRMHRDAPELYDLYTRFAEEHPLLRNLVLDVWVQPEYLAPERGPVRKSTRPRSRARKPVRALAGVRRR